MEVHMTAKSGRHQPHASAPLVLQTEAYSYLFIPCRSLVGYVRVAY